MIKRIRKIAPKELRSKTGGYCLDKTDIDFILTSYNLLPKNQQHKFLVELLADRGALQTATEELIWVHKKSKSACEIESAFAHAERVVRFSKQTTHLL